MNTVKISVSVLLLAVVVWGCNIGKPSKKEKENLARFYTDYMIAMDTTSLQGNTNEVQEKIQNMILPKYGLNPVSYKELIKRMKNNPGEWESFYELVMAELKTRRDTAKRNTFF